MARRFRRGSRGTKNNIWTVVQIEQSLVNIAAIQATIAQASEWQGAGTAFMHVTLLRIRGWLSVAPLLGSAGSSVFAWAIYVVDEDAANVSPLNTSLYTSEDVLASGGLVVSDTGVGDVERVVGKEWVIDVKSMRKMRTGSEVRLSIATDVNGAYNAFGVLRALIRKGGN